MPFNDVAKNTMLAATDITYVGVHTLVDPGTGTTANAGEATGGSYARQPVTFATAASGVRTNSGALVIPVDGNSTTPPQYGFLTFWTAVSGNTTQYRGYSPMGGASALKGFGSVDTNLANDTLFSVAHGLADTNRVVLYNVFAETLPTGLTEGTIYFVVGSTTNSFKVSLSSGGAAVDVTAVGGGEFYWQQVVWEQFNAPGNITVAIGALALDLTAM